jgi:hypothetical protein
VPNTPPNFRAAPAPPNAGTSSLPTVFRRTPTGIEPVKTFTPEPGPGKVVMYSAAPGGPLVLDPAPTLRGSVGGIVVQVAPHAVERGVEWMGFDHTDARRAGFVTSVLATARLGASMGAVDEGIGAVPGAIIGAVIGALAYGFEGLTGHYGPRSNPVFNIIVDPDNPYPTGPQWGDPTTGY